MPVATEAPPAATEVADPTFVDRTRAPTRIALYWALARVVAGFVFLWTFLDKLFGLGFETQDGWLDGHSPTAGFLQHGVDSRVGEFFRDLTGGGGGWIDWVFMTSMAMIGCGLITGVMSRLAAIGGVIWMALLYAATFAPEQNPVVDQHIAYLALLIGIAIYGAGRRFGLGPWWNARLPRGRAAFWLGG